MQQHELKLTGSHVWSSALSQNTFDAASAGAGRLLRHLHAQGVPFCLATSSHQRHYQLKTTQHRQLFSLFQHCITGAASLPQSCDQTHPPR